MSTIWITPDLTTPGVYSYNATITDDTLRVWLHLQDRGRGRYVLSASVEKRAHVRGRLGKRQWERAMALKAELEPLFRAALSAAGWVESTDPVLHIPRWTRS